MSNRNRLDVIILIILVSFCVVLIRLFYLQILKHSYFEKLSDEQRIRAIEISPQRGDILDRNGNLLATSIQRWSVYVRPRAISDDQKKSVLEQLINIDKGKEHLIREKFAKSQNFWLVRKADKEFANKVIKINCPAIDVIPESKRVYPNANLASQLIGFVGIDNRGLSGIELAYDEDLFGVAGKSIVEKDPFGRQIFSAPSKVIIPPSDGMNIYLTIDESIQYVAQRELSKIVKESGAIRGSIIVMDVKNGDILAICGYPDFNPNEYSKFDPKTWRLSPITDLYEPGSTFKMITACSGLEEKIVDLNSVIPCPDELKIGGITVKNSHPVKMYGKQFKTFLDVIAESINTGTAYVSIKLGKNKFYEHIKKFGFGELTGIDFPGEQKGILLPPNKWHDSDVATISFGQTIAVTPLQLICAISAIANDGSRIKPRLIKKIESVDTSIIRYIPEQRVDKVISSDTAKKAIKLMEFAVNGEHATGKKAKIDNFSVAAKTGTAQKPIPGKGYVVGRYIASIVGFIPASNPRIAILVVIDEPKSSIWGATIAAPVFKNVGEFALRFLSIPPDL